VLEAWPGHPLLGSLGFGGEKAVTQGLEAFCVLLIKPYFWWGGGCEYRGRRLCGSEDHGSLFLLTY